MDAENNNIVYDAENAPAPELVEESLNKDDVVYDFQDEINKTAEKNGVDPVQKKEEPSTETEDENLEFKPKIRGDQLFFKRKIDLMKEY